jgi:tRNA uridine 5-carboxymethylaminomethyl modification enzyme
LEQAVAEQAEITIKYEGYLRRQQTEVDQLAKYERANIPADFDFAIPGLSREIQEKLAQQRPMTLGQAGRIPGITPAAIAILSVYIERQRRERNAV